MAEIIMRQSGASIKLCHTTLPFFFLQMKIYYFGGIPGMKMVKVVWDFFITPYFFYKIIKY